MNLTPVRIRGKKRPAVEQRHRSNIRVNTSAESCSIGKQQRLIVPFNAPDTRFLPSNSGSKGQRVLSFLEALPTELLEEIFLQCINISLPRCSPILAQKLSSDRVKDLFLRKTCNVSKNEQFFDNTKALASFQSDILNLRWMTLPFLRRYMPEYITQTLTRELDERKLHWPGNSTSASPDIKPTIRESITALFPPPSAETKPYHEVHWDEPNPQRHIIVYLGPLDGVVGLTIINQTSSFDPEDDTSKDQQRTSYKWRFLNFEHGCRIPAKLLRGPWTDEKCDFLDIVIRGNASIDWDHTTSGEIAHGGFMDALRTRNLRAIKALLVRRHPAALPGERKDFFEKEGFDDSAHVVGIVPETRHLRCAVIELDCPLHIVEALVYAPESKIDAKDDQVWDWVHERKFYEHPKAAWLEKKLLWLIGKQAEQRFLALSQERNDLFFPQTRV